MNFFLKVKKRTMTDIFTNVIYVAFFLIMFTSVYVWIRIIKNTPIPIGSIYDKDKTQKKYSQRPPGVSFL